MGERVQVTALSTAEHGLERGLGNFGQLPDEADSAAMELLGRHDADTPEALHRKRVELELSVGRDEE